MKELVKSKFKTVLKEIARAAVSAILAALGLAASSTATGCTTVITPADEAPSVSVTGAIPLGFQFNGNKVNNSVTERGTENG